MSIARLLRSTEKDVDRESTVISFDLGENATAYCIGRIRNRDGRMVVTVMGIAVMGIVSCAMDACVSVEELLSRLPPADVYLIEEQPSINRKTCMLEAALGARARGTVVHVPTSRMTAAYNLPPRAAGRKAVSVQVARNSMAGLDVAAEARALFDRVARKHDLSDALNQLVWYARTGRREIGAAERHVRATDPRNASAERHRRYLRDAALERKMRSTIDGPRRKRRKRATAGTPALKRQKT